MISFEVNNQVENRDVFQTNKKAMFTDDVIVDIFQKIGLIFMSEQE